MIPPTAAGWMGWAGSGSRDNSPGFDGSLDTHLQPDSQFWDSQGRANPPQVPAAGAGSDLTEGAFN